ncbi:hypothetical protein [Chamaesiphon sp. VAR_48_metabat_403]|uniref:hypothetical protein n=1 Tax=Chamaesiphon sp. VAR_48_metabat_403 TaxID=2964700 RepID=UPI00286EACEC|nr:hypothetical protein [Chamaesiphon sp. VAR_48_metabat_403]
MWKKVLGGIVFVFLGLIVALKHISNVVNEYYSPGYVSQSIAMSRNNKVFISQPTLIRKTIHWEKSEYPIREAWIEQTIQFKYDWIFFGRIVPTGHQLIVAIEQTGKPAGRDFAIFGHGIVCNNSIYIADTQFGSPMLLSKHLSGKLPASLDCVAEKNEN